MSDLKITVEGGGDAFLLSVGQSQYCVAAVYKTVGAKWGDANLEFFCDVGLDQLEAIVAKAKELVGGES